MKPDFRRFSTNFSRGLSLASPHLINPEECQVADNFLFDGGTPYVREGIAVHASLPAPVVSLKKLYTRAGSAFFFSFTTSGIYSSIASGVFNNISGSAVGSDISLTTFGDYLYYTNHSTPPKYTDGSSVDNVGLSSPIFRKQILDFETTESIPVTTGGGSTYFDTNYMKIDHGKRSFVIYTSGGTTIATTSAPFNLDSFASNVSSDFDDLIEIFIVHKDLASVNNIDVIFADTAPWSVTMHVTNMSAFTSCSSNSYGITYSLNKRNLTSGTGMVWGSVARVSLGLAPNSIAGREECIVNFDNLRMTKTPPLLTSISAVYMSGRYFYGSSIYKPSKRRYSTYDNDPTLPEGTVVVAGKSEKLKGIQEGLVQFSAPLPAFGGMEYYYKCTFVKRGPFGIDIESDPTYQTSAIMISTNGSTWQFIKLTNIPLAPSEFGVNGRRIYRRRRDESYFSHVYSIADNVQTQFIDNIPWNALGDVLEEDHDPPPQAKYIYSAGNQLTYYFNTLEEGINYPSRVRWSKAYEPHYCPVENAIDISPNDGTEGTGVFEYMNLTHFLKERSTWAIDESNTLRNIHQSIGNVADKSIAVGKNEVYWLSEEGIIMYNLRFRNISKGEPGDANKNRIDAIIKRLPTQYIKNAAGTYYNGFYLLAVTDVGSTTNNLVICYDSINDCFSTFPNLNVNCWTTWQGYKDGYRLFFGNNSGLICEFLTGNYDISTSISSRIRTKEFGITVPTHAFRKAWLHTENLDGNLRTVNVKPYYDFNNLSADNQSVVVSGTYALTKIDLPQKDNASFCSLEFSSSGRFRINQVDLLGKEGEIR